MSAERSGNVTTQGTKVVRVGFWDVLKNDDGSYSLYDNNRGGGDEVFHEQVIVIRPSGPSFDLKEGNAGLGSLEFDLITGGWEGEYVDFSLLDFGHAEAGAEFKDGRFRLGAMASAWSPSIAFEIFDIEIELGLVNIKEWSYACVKTKKIFVYSNFEFYCDYDFLVIVLL